MLSPYPKGEKIFDYAKILALSGPDFETFYFELMTVYRDKHGWWGEGKPVFCSGCHSEIPGPESMRRLKGRVLDPPCFRKFYIKESEYDGDIMKRYWERVAHLEIAPRAGQAIPAPV